MKTQLNSVSRKALFSGAVAVLAYGIFVVVTGLDSVAHAFQVVGLHGWSILLALSLGNYLLRFFRWDRFLRILGHRVSGKFHVLVYVAGFAFTATPGKAGEAVRMLYLHPHGVRYAEATATLVAERMLDLLAIAVLALPLLYWIPMYKWVVAGFAGALFLVVIVVLARRLLPRLQALIPYKSSKRFAEIRAAIRTSVDSSRLLFGKRPLVLGLITGIIAWGLEAFGFYLTICWLNCTIDVYLAMSIYAVSILAGALSFLPGGLGTTEATMISLLSVFGIPVGDAVAATMVCRIATLWFAIILGLVSSLVLLGKGHKPAGQGEDVAH